MKFQNIILIFFFIGPISCLNFDDALILSELSHDRDDGLRFESRGLIPFHRIEKREVKDHVQVYSFKITSDIKYRYSRTCVTSRVMNQDEGSSHEVTFQVVLPETAFISKFNMEIDGKVYEAYVKEKDEAKRIYIDAKYRGQSAGIVELHARHSNIFQVNINVKAESRVSFNLTYEELLQRRLGRYEQAININPDQVTNLEDIEVVVNIEESQEIILIHVPNLRNDIEVEESSNEQNNQELIERLSKNTARVTWHPSPSDQKKLKARIGKFVVQYDVKRELDAGEVLISQGYFVHFFAPKDLRPLQKHLVFVLDISGSMMGRKIVQLREAMKKILSDLKEDDFLNIIIFSTSVTHWAPGDIFSRPRQRFHHFENYDNSGDEWKKQPFLASRSNILHAQNFIESLPATDGTNIHDALISALNLISNTKNTRKYYGSYSEDDHKSERFREGQSTLPPNVESLIMFLTDGEPTVGITNPTDILSRIRSANLRTYVPIFSLAFGEGADFMFLRRLSLQNHGFARKIYEAADASIQLKGFYNEISSPLLSNVRFNYTSPDYEVNEVTTQRFATLFGGSELAVAGKITPTGSADRRRKKRRVILAPHPSPSLIRYPPVDDCYFPLNVAGQTRQGHHVWHRPIVYSHWNWWCHPHPPIPPPTTRRPSVITQEDYFLERLWAYLTIQQLIDRDFAQESQYKDSDGSSSEETPRQRALRLALKYGFVTTLTSLVVVKPSGNDETGAFSADKTPNRGQNQMVGSSLSSFGHGPSGGASVRRYHKVNSHGGSMKFSKSDDFEESSMASIESDRPAQPATTTSTQPSEKKEAEKPKDSSRGEDADSISSSKKSTESSSKKSKSLNDILWLTDLTIIIGKKEYKVVPQDSEEGDGTDVGHECEARHKKGECKHLKDCVRSAFLDNFKLYESSYFCPIRDSRAGHTYYAGACCSKHKS